MDTSPDVLSVAQQILRGITSHLGSARFISQGHLKQAVAAGFGFQSEAALVAASGRGRRATLSEWNVATFMDRLSAMSGGYGRCDIACAATAASGIGLITEFEGAGEDGTSARVGVRVTLTGAPHGAHPNRSGFQLPDRFASASHAGAVTLVSRAGYGEGAPGDVGQGANAVMIDGVWCGELTMPATMDNVERQRHLTSLRHALVRSVLPIFAPVARVRIDRPEGYHPLMWRADSVLTHVGSWLAKGIPAPSFELPQIGALFMIHTYHREYVRPGINGRLLGCYINNEWRSDLRWNDPVAPFDERRLAEFAQMLRVNLIRQLLRSGG